MMNLKRIDRYAFENRQASSAFYTRAVNRTEYKKFQKLGV